MLLDDENGQATRTQEVDSLYNISHDPFPCKMVSSFLVNVGYIARQLPNAIAFSIKLPGSVIE